MQTLKVSSASDPGATAGAIANGIRQSGAAQIEAIGPRAVNQAVKAIAIARGYLAAGGVDVYCVPCFIRIRLAEGDEERTAIRFRVATRHGISPGDGGSPRPPAGC